MVIPLATKSNVPLHILDLKVHCADFLSLKVLIENFLSPNAVDCYMLGLQSNGLTSRHAYHLILLLTQARYLLELDISDNPGLRGVIPLLLSAAKYLKTLNLVDMINDQELLEMALVLQSNTNLTRLDIYSVILQRRTYYSKESLIKFLKIVTAPESKSRLEKITVGHSSDNKDTVARLPAELTNMALSRGHSLKITHINEYISFVAQSDSAIAPLASAMTLGVP